MFVVWGWGKVTKKNVGGVFQKLCSYCNRTEIWQLCIARTWFTLFFIPIIPYKKRYCISCPSCGSYIELTQEQFEKLRLDIESNSSSEYKNELEEAAKYAGKTETQINYLKQMEKFNSNDVV